MTKFIFGHKNPDSDSILSTIVYGNYLKSSKQEEIEVCSLGELNLETKFILEKFGVEKPKLISGLPENSQVILLDHNEKSQTIEKIENLDLVEVIDHHKISLSTHKPIKLRFEPIGSTCSIIAKILFENNFDMSKTNTSLLICGILSDTLHFRSPTTTNEDKEIVHKLNKVAKVDDLEKLGLDMFEAKSDLGDINAEELIKLDYKEFKFGEETHGIGVCETTNPNYSLNRLEEIKVKLDDIKEKNNLQGIFFSIIDILKKEAHTICSNKKDEELFTKLFEAEKKGKALFVKDLISRKKQIVPKFEKHFNK
jgi:manganese-dependent inorganic pyrophosphatase